MTVRQAELTILLRLSRAAKELLIMGKNQHIVPRAGGWAVRGENNSRVTSQHRTQAEAIDAGRQIARHQHSELVIHGRDGRIKDKDSHGHDPYPPKG